MNDAIEQREQVGLLDTQGTDPVHAFLEGCSRRALQRGMGFLYQGSSGPSVVSSQHT
ncbi:MAG TPA: hypothetical protein VFA49_06785 [Chloroflexota bacterium]|jgi:hypothetical protein|nr:hypothetical protein [Chloroflexota bacterium]